MMAKATKPVRARKPKASGKDRPPPLIYLMKIGRRSIAWPGTRRCSLQAGGNRQSMRRH